ncbi:MAG TPA: hypothetical protein PLV45_01065 [bacterium]|nr:hypothetical protein [bacterium]
MKTEGAYRALFIGLIILISGCAHERYYCEPGDGCYTLADYDDAVEQWLAHDEIHDRMISLADAQTLYLAWELRQAYLDLLKNTAAADKDYIDTQRERAVNQFEQGHEFHLGLYCYDKSWYRLTGQDPIWRMTLTTDQRITVRPFLIEEIQISPDNAWKHLNRLALGRKVYRVVFPKEDADSVPVITKETRWFELQCHSLLGTLTMHWDLEPIPNHLR